MNSCRVSVTEHDHRDDAGAGQRQCHAQERAVGVVAVDQRRLLGFRRDRLEEAHQQPGAERHRDGGIDHDQRQQRITESEGHDDAEQGNEQQRRRHQVDDEHEDAGAFAPAPGEARQRVGGRQRQEQRDHHHRRAHHHGVADEDDVVGVVEQVVQVFQGGRLGVVERTCVALVEVAVGLEGGDAHHQERRRRQDAEQQHGDGVERAPVMTRRGLTCVKEPCRAITAPGRGWRCAAA